MTPLGVIDRQVSFEVHGKLNIVVVNDFAYFNGGAAKIALGSAMALALLGHSVTVFTAVGPVAPELTDTPKIEVICLGQKEIVSNPNRGQAVVQGFWNFAAATRMRVLLASLDKNETIIHVHGWTKALSSSVVQAAISLGFRVVITLHDYFVACPAGTFYNHPQHAICHLRPMSAACISSNCDSRNYRHKLWRVGRQWVQNHLGRLAEDVQEYIAISTLGEEILKPLLPRSARIHRVNNFNDVAKLPKVDVETNQHFTFSGRLSAEKGPVLFAECARNSGVEALVIGDGPLRQQIQNIAPKATYTGWLSHADGTAQLRRSRALVFPSLWYEMQGLVVAEAAAMGIPAIVPDTSAAREWVTDGISGFWFRGGDAKDLIAKMKHLNDNPSIAAIMGNEAYNRYWRSPPTLDAHCEGLQKVYRTILTTSSIRTSR